MDLCREDHHPCARRNAGENPAEECATEGSLNSVCMQKPFFSQSRDSEEINQEFADASVFDVPPWQQRTALLLGEENLKRLEKAHVFVAGLGGVGGIAAEMIARAGVGEMTLADGDIVEDSNRNRQLAALTGTVGRLKTEVIAERLLQINPAIRLHLVSEYLQNETLTDALTRAFCSCVLDAIDSISPKLFLILNCIENHIPIVSCMGSGARLNPELVRCADISETSGCSLARVMRKRLRKHGVEKGLKVIYSPELPLPGSVVETDDGLLHKRSVTGTISYMPAVFGCHCASAVIQQILGSDLYKGSRKKD